jgi:DNA processing protein
MNQKKETEAALILSRLPGVGAASFKKLLIEHNLPSIALAQFKTTKTNKKTSLNTSEALLFLEANQDVSLLWPFHKSYPEILSQITEPPPVLFVKGKPKIFTSKSLKVAIVGARKASEAGLELTNSITTQFCREGAIIVSGLAEGIDTCAHQVALQEKAETIAIMATGIDVCFPKKNQNLYEQICKKGLVCTEFFPTTPPMASFFPTRNRIIAALADIIIMIEGTEKSGALYTIKNGIKFGKKVYIPDFKNSKLIKEGLRKAQTLGAEIYQKKTVNINQEKCT